MEPTLKKTWRTAVALICALAFAVVDGRAHAAEITVCSSGCDYASIQDAVDDAAPGDTLLLGSETLYEHVRTEKDVTTRGSGPDHTTVDGSGSWGAVFRVEGLSVTRVALAECKCDHLLRPRAARGRQP